MEIKNMLKLKGISLINDLKYGVINRCSFDVMPYDIISQALTECGFNKNDDFDTNGWQVDYWQSWTFENLLINVAGSMYYGNCTLEIEKEDEK